MEIKPEHIIEARKAYLRNQNIEKYLKDLTGYRYAASDIAEVSFDIQSGSYIEDVLKDSSFMTAYTKEYASILQEFISSKSFILDVGCGEMTTLTYIIKSLIKFPKIIAAMDISLSRIILGMDFSWKQLGMESKNIIPFVGDAFNIPLASGAVDVTITNYGLYSYGENIDFALKEIYRVTRERVLLFENNYKYSLDNEARKRMENLGYVLDFEGAIERTGGKLERVIEIKNNKNNLTPTFCYVVTPPSKTEKSIRNNDKLMFSIPGSDYPLIEENSFLASAETGLCFPIIKQVPILKPDVAILGSALIDTVK